MSYKNKLPKLNQRLYYVVLLLIAITFSACAHPITINPSITPKRTEEHPLSTKLVAYVMTDADRAKQVTTEGGGGDKVSYFPYKDMEKGLRDALKSLYADVILVQSPSNFEELKQNGVYLVFAPEIYTTSNSNSLFTWPPTQFSIDLSCTVTDGTGNMLSRVRVTGQGAATFSEFTSDFGLAGKRAAQDALEKFVNEIKSNNKLR